MPLTEHGVDLPLRVALARLEVLGDQVKDDDALGVVRRDGDEPPVSHEGTQDAGGIGGQAFVLLALETGLGVDHRLPEGLLDQPVVVVVVMQDQLAVDEPGQRRDHGAGVETGRLLDVVGGRSAQNQRRQDASTVGMCQMPHDRRRVGAHLFTLPCSVLD